MILNFHEIVLNTVGLSFQKETIFYEKALNASEDDLS